MRRGRLRLSRVAGALALVTLATAGARSCLAQTEQDLADLARKSQDPISDLISVPFQNNLNFGVGPRHELQYVLNIQPVVPFRLTSDWSLITRTIVPLIYQPELAPGVGDVFGLGDIQLSLFLAPLAAFANVMRPDAGPDWSRACRSSSSFRSRQRRRDDE